jgi:hypothetical protein
MCTQKDIDLNPFAGLADTLQPTLITLQNPAMTTLTNCSVTESGSPQPALLIATAGTAASQTLACHSATLSSDGTLTQLWQSLHTTGEAR